MKKLRQLLLTVTLVMAALVVLPGPCRINAQAAKSITANANYKKAPTIKGKGVYYVTAKKNNSYVRFKAPSSGKWTITISNIRDYKKSSNASTNLGNWWPQKLIKNSSGSYFGRYRVRTNGGTTDCLFTATKRSYNNYHKTKKPTTGTYLASRKAVMNLKKGEVVYFQYFYTGDKCQYTLTVKK